MTEEIMKELTEETVIKTTEKAAERVAKDAVKGFIKEAKVPDTYIVIDLETTGLSAKLDKIIEIGAVKFVNGEEAEIFSSYVNSGVKLPERITELTGIVEEDLQDAPEISDLLEELDTFLGDEVLVGHNLLFDFSFLKRAFSFQRRDFNKQGIDTLRIARTCLPQLEHKNLGDLCRYYDISLKAHRAVSDARATGFLFQRLLQEFGEKEELKKCFIPQPLVYQVKKDSPATTPQKELLHKLHSQYNIVPEYDVERLSKSEASRYIDQILSAHRAVNRRRQKQELS